MSFLLKGSHFSKILPTVQLTKNVSVAVKFGFTVISVSCRLLCRLEMCVVEQLDCPRFIELLVHLRKDIAIQD